MTGEITVPSFSSIKSGSTIVSKEVNPNDVLRVIDFFKASSYSDSAVDDFISLDSFSVLFQRHTQVLSVDRGRISCSVTVTPALCNYFNGLHGGSVASIAERVAMACAKTVVSEEKPLFLGELSMSYLSSAPIGSEVLIEGTVVRTGRNMTMVTIVFKLKDTMKMTYQSRATIYHNLVSKL